MKFFYLLLSVATLLLAGCVRPAAPVPTAEDPLADFIDAPTAVFQQATASPTSAASDDDASDATLSVDTLPGGTEPPATNAPAASPSPFILTPTADGPTPTSAFTETPEGARAATSVPTNTPTQAPTPDNPQLDPIQAFGGARFDEQFADDANWIGNDGNLPDSDYIKLDIQDGKMGVTGKNLEFDTWWFTASTLGDAYIEMEVNSGDCEGTDAYGLILRGAPTGEPAHGYIVALTCDGRFFVRRLDTTDPYTVSQLFIYTPDDSILRGASQINKLGVLAVGEEFTIYANGQIIAYFIDNTFDVGRYGVFVKPGETENYTYAVNRIRVWDLRDD